MISPEDLGLFHYVETAEEAWARLADHYGFDEMGTITGEDYADDAHGRSMNAELREIVRAALTMPRRDSAAQFKQLAAEIRALSAGRRQTPSEQLLRASRAKR